MICIQHNCEWQLYSRQHRRERQALRIDGGQMRIGSLARPRGGTRGIGDRGEAYPTITMCTSPGLFFRRGASTLLGPSALALFLVGCKLV